MRERLDTPRGFWDKSKNQYPVGVEIRTVLRKEIVMHRRFIRLVCLVVFASGCAGGFGMGKLARQNEQWEPEVAESAPPTSEWSPLRKGKARPETWLDRMLWSDESREIIRNTGGDY